MRVRTALLLFALAVTPLAAKPYVQVIFSPNGGFDPTNKATKIKLHNGKWVEPNLNTMARDMMERTGPGGRIELAMYAFSDWRALDVMIDRAMDGVAVRMILDNCAAWTGDMVKETLNKLRKAGREAKKAGIPFDFHYKTIPCDRFLRYGRAKQIVDKGKKKMIKGTMHEKFGVFFAPRRKMPTYSFAGSSNFSKAAATNFAENRTFYWNDPVSAAQLHEEFQRLWKYYGVCRFGDCEEIGKIRNAEGGRSGVKMVFNGEPRQGGDPIDPRKVRYRRIDNYLKWVLDQTRPRGTIDFAMFSFTHKGLMRKILNTAKKNPRAKVRVMLDLSMMADDNPDRPGVVGPLMEREAKEMGLRNIEFRYKWRSNAHSYDPEDESIPPGLYHFKSHLLHHKLVIVNKEILATGSYNWSGGAEWRNLENIQAFFRNKEGQAEVVEAFIREFDALWNSKNPEDPKFKNKWRANPQMVGGDQGRDLQKRIVKVLEMKDAKAVQFAMDKWKWDPQPAWHSLAEIADEAGISKARTKKVLEAMKGVTMTINDRRGRWALAD